MMFGLDSVPRLLLLVVQVGSSHSSSSSPPDFITSTTMCRGQNGPGITIYDG